MRKHAAELVAVGLTIIGILAATFVPFRHEAASVLRNVPPGAQVIELTGVASGGVWTEEAVTGSNYWRRDFQPARPVLRMGRPALFRLKSADVIHTFYVPALGIGPVDVRPGHVEEILVTPTSEGVFGHFCTIMCGDPHFGMLGVIIVAAEGTPPPAEARPTLDRYWESLPPRAEAGRTERGKWLFHQKGCMTCHGVGGRGGVPNYNYVNGTVPALNTLAEKMFLFFPEDIDAVVDLLERGVPLESVEEDPPLPRFGATLAQYDSVRKVIRVGNPAGKKDPAGPPPPLEMPAWQYQLSDSDIDAIIAYLLTLGSEEG
jgi:mono/diheme cytochrome c family protein